MKQLMKSLIPPLLLELYRKYRNSNYGWFGDYDTWEEAKKASTGYDSKVILEKVRNSLLKVKNGEAVYERDSVNFDEIQYSWLLLAGLMYAAAKSQGALHVIDFGGSLGSTYFQNKKFLDGLKEVSWSIIEQKQFVEIGKKEFEDERLKFYDDIKSCFTLNYTTILVLSGVLQYIEKPYVLLEELLKFDFEFIVIDRTPFARQERLTVQKVPPSIYEASYPCWFFEEEQFLKLFEKYDYKVIECFDALDGKTNHYIFKGFLLEKKLSV